MVTRCRYLWLVALVACLWTGCNKNKHTPLRKTCGSNGIDDTAAAQWKPESLSGGVTGQIAIEYIAHSSFFIHSPSGKVILIDPYLSNYWLGYAFPYSGNVHADAIAVTHPHYDHDSGVFIGRPWPFDRSIPVIRDPGDYTIGDIHLYGFPGKHSDPWGKQFGQKNNLFLFEVGGLRIAHLGDNGPLTSANIAALGKVDILMMPIDRDEHILKAAEARAIIDALNPSVVIPMHYRMKDLEGPESPRGLGNIEPWAACQTNVFQLQGNIQVFHPADFPQTTRILVFQHTEDLNFARTTLKRLGVTEGLDGGVASDGGAASPTETHGPR
jgi:L-ascorbate metabolism protein UlaG (beta-lactamase superfamily)